MKEFTWDMSKDGDNIKIKHRERGCADELSQSRIHWQAFVVSVTFRFNNNMKIFQTAEYVLTAPYQEVMIKVA
jgi:hypothetical protein